MNLPAASDIATFCGIRSPKELTIAITGACNLVCRHCLVGSGVVSSAPHVPLHSIIRLLDELASLGGEGIRITGGEPLCHHGWLDILSHARSNGFQRIALQTNGMLLDGTSAEALRRLDFPGLSIQISLDGSCEEHHDFVRGTGSFERAVRGIRFLGEAGLAGRVSIFFTEMAHNLEDIPELLELAAGLGVRSVSSGTLVRSGRAASFSAMRPPMPAQYQRLIERYAGDEHFRNRYRLIGTVAALEWFTSPTPRTECCTFAENPYITPRGTLYPCLMCHVDNFSVGDVFEKGLAASLAEGAAQWSSLMQISHCRVDAIAECRNCPGRSLCGGGCMGRAWGSHGDLLSADDRCEVRRLIYTDTGGVSPPP